MIDKQQLQAMGEHQAEQHMCMAKQIEDLQARLQECANGAAKMQEQRDAAYVMAGKSGLERDKFAQQLKAANRKIAVMTELLREVVVRDDFDREDGDSAGRLLYRIDAVLSGNQPDHVAGVGNMVLDGWKLVPVEPTQEMIEVGCEHEGSRINDGAAYARALYAEMLAAAPKLEPTK